MRLSLEHLWRASIYRLKLVARGRIDLVWYALRSRFKGFDFASVSLEKLGLSPERSILHGNSGGPDLARVLKTITISPGSRLVDFGSGKGGAVLTLSEFPFAEIAGVELSADLIRIAEANVRRADLRHVRFVHADAADFTELDRFTHVYMYHPFPCNVVKEVMANLAKSLARVERDVTLIYANPVCHDTILEAGFFTLEAEFQGRDKFGVYRHDAGGGRGKSS